MKKGLLTLLLFAFGMAIYAQEESDSTQLSKDTTYTIEWGKKTIIIVDKGDIDDDEDEDTDIKITIGKNRQRFNHYAGIDFGLNGMVNEAMSVSLRDDEMFMDQNYWGSWYLAFNIVDEYIPFWEEKIGMTIGFGIEFNKYKLSRSYDIVNVNDSTFGIVDSMKVIDKNLFKSTMLNLPIMLETNLGKDAEHSFHLSAGAMLSYRLGSKTKQKYSLDGEKYKDKSRGDFNMEEWRLSLVARVGYGRFTVFANYSLTPFFKEDRGPELYPFSVGIALVPF